MNVLVKYLGSQDKDILEKTYDDASNDRKLPPKQYPTLEGIKTILEPLAETDPKAKLPRLRTLSIRFYRRAGSERIH
jgi:hypothetical protein